MSADSIDARAFNLIAPLAIYFCADVCWKDEAEIAWNGLRKEFPEVAAGLCPEENVKGVSVDCGFECFDVGEVKRAYNEAIESAVESFVGDAMAPGIDEWGAKEFRCRHCHEHVLAGDDYGMYAYYGDAESVEARLRTHFESECCV